MKSNYINFYKGLAILMVIATHTGAGSLPYGLGKFGMNGARGVQLFFVISAYLSFVSYARATQKNPTDHYYAFKWLVKKYKKLLPLYFVSIVIYLVLMGTGSRYWLGSLEKVSWLNILSHVLCLHGFYPYYINSIQGVEWYLADLCIFYLLTPFLYKWITSWKRSILFLVAGNAISVLLSYILCGFCPIKDGYIWKTYVTNFAFFSQLPVWLLGIVLFFVYEEKEKIKTMIGKEKWIWSWGFLGAHILLLLCLVSKFSIPGVSGWLLWGVVFLLLIFSEELREHGMFHNKAIEYIGKVSYPIYLFHYAFIYVWENYFEYQEMKLSQFLFKYIVIVSCSVIVAVIIYQGSEKFKCK